MKKSKSIIVLDTAKLDRESVQSHSQIKNIARKQKRGNKMMKYASIGLKSGIHVDDGLEEELEELLDILQEREEELSTVAQMTLKLSTEKRQLILELERLQNRVMSFEEEEETSKELEGIIDELSTEVRELTKRRDYLSRRLEEGAELNKIYLSTLEEKETNVEQMKVLVTESDDLAEKNDILKREIMQLEDVDVDHGGKGLGTQVPETDCNPETT